ncbi:Urocanate hydratase [compost metagenome]
MAIRKGELSAPIVLGRDHHDVSGTDSPYRETSNIYDGSKFTADMAIHNVIGDSFRGATWVSIHNGGGVGWGEVINGGFGLLLDGSEDADRKLENMLFYDVNNGIARRAWAQNDTARQAIEVELARTKSLKVTLANRVETVAINQIFEEYGD